MLEDNTYDFNTVNEGLNDLERSFQALQTKRDWCEELLSGDEIDKCDDYLLPIMRDVAKAKRDFRIKFPISDDNGQLLASSSEHSSSGQGNHLDFVAHLTFDIFKEVEVFDGSDISQFSAFLSNWELAEQKMESIGKSKIQMFSALKRVLEGEARSFIVQLPPHEDSLVAALDILKRIYNKPSLQVRQIVTQLFTLPQLVSNASSIKTFLALARGCNQRLTSLDITKEEFDNPKTPSLENLFRFLENQLEQIEQISSPLPNSQNKSAPTKKDPVLPNSFTTSLSTNNTIPRFPFQTLFERFSSWGSIVSTMSYVQRFIKSSRGQQMPKTSLISPDEFRTSEVIWFQIAQRSVYLEEINALQFGKNVSSSSPIKSLLPTLQNNTLTMTSRLDYANLPYRSTHPIILPKHPITRKYVLHIHVSNFHASARLTMSLVRQHHWLVGTRRELRKILHTCPSTRCLKPTKIQPVMAPLPPERSEEPSAFEHVSLDFFDETRRDPKMRTIEWHFSTELAPWTNALSERLIREVKRALRPTLGRQTLSFRALENILAECEGILNARPLGFVSDQATEDI
ncbi:hypothetical protein TCAL_10040, partial [Tigriopus californicus]|eukprot:TCALIF_10040-PA protein Name:"Protein of unknown function" AED:0.25 eAED:0.25 QI:34/0/0/1/0/0/4/0/570